MTRRGEETPLGAMFIKIRKFIAKVLASLIVKFGDEDETP